MSNVKRNLLGQGLLSAACCGLVLAIGAGADKLPAQGQTTPPAPRAEGERYLLLTDGRLIRGLISQDEDTYTVTQKVGVIRYPKRQVERAFGSVQEAYLYRLERAPEDDPAERLRLARWCLSHHLDKEARMLLEQVVEISPDHGPARAMLTKIQQAEAARIARIESKVDDEIRQTGGEAIAEDRPGALDAAVLKGAEKRMGITGLPVIFDLPQAMAVSRAEQFKQYVHPVLQAYCAKCHNDDYQGPFHLVAVKNVRRNSPDAIRSNLDASLRLIDRENPVRSELLSSTLRPHGTGGRKRPIFSGSNDRAYQILAAWVTSLRPQSNAETMSTTAGRTPAGSAEAFATDRLRAGADPSDELTRGTPPGDRRPPAMRRPTVQGDGLRSYRFVEGQGIVPEDPNQSDPREFPVPYMLGGPRPTVPAASPNKANRPSRVPASEAAEQGISPDSGLPELDEPRMPVSTRDPAIPDAPRSGSTSTQATSAVRKKPVKIDPKILERFLQKSAGRPDGQ